MNKKKVLFLCTHNSARSQIAEGLLKNLYGDRFDAFSAGTKPSSVSPYAIEAMKEIGIDISNHRSKSMEEFRGMKIDYVITVCDNAKEACPFFPDGARYLHKSFNDPSQFKGTREEMLPTFRHTRDEIKEWIDKTFSQEIEQTDEITLELL